MMDEISKGHLYGAYGIKVSNDMTEILQKYMIENVSFKLTSIFLLFTMRKNTTFSEQITDIFFSIFSLIELNSSSSYPFL